MVIYTDGSDIRGQVGGAAVSRVNQKWSCQMAYIGRSEQSAVYAAELAGLLLALQMAISAGPEVRQVVIFTDNQAAILSAKRPASQSGQWLLRLLTQQLDGLTSSGVRVAIHWIAAHEGVSCKNKLKKVSRISSYVYSHVFSLVCNLVLKN